MKILNSSNCSEKLLTINKIVNLTLFLLIMVLLNINLESLGKFNIYVVQFLDLRSTKEKKKDGESELYCACSNNSIEEVRELLPSKKHAKFVNIVTKSGFTPLFFASLYNNLEMVELLIKSGAEKSINIASVSITPLYLASYSNNLDMVKLLLENGAQESVNKVNIFGETPLHRACYNNNLEMVKTLLVNNANPNIVNIIFQTALCFACKNNIEIVKELLKYGAKETINIGLPGNIPLTNACRSKNINIVRELLKNGAKDNENASLYCACKNNDIEMAKLLFEYDINRNMCWLSIDLTTFIYLACENNNLEMLELFFKENINPELIKNIINIADTEYGFTPLYLACHRNNLDMVILLLERGAKESVNIASKSSQTPLYWAFRNSNLETIKLLLANGADFDEKTILIAKTKPEILKALNLTL